MPGAFHCSVYNCKVQLPEGNIIISVLKLIQIDSNKLSMATRLTS